MHGQHAIRAIPAFRQDMQHGLRQLGRAPGFTLAAVVMLGLGVGGATAMFGIVDSVLLRPLPYPDSHRIVTLAEVADDGRVQRVSLPAFRDWGTRARSFEAITAMRGEPATIVTSAGGQSPRGYAMRFHGDVLRVFGTPIAHGRAFTRDEIATGAPVVAVVSNGFALRVWGDARKAVGETITLADVHSTIVGVLQSASDERADAFIPAAAFGPDTSTRGDRVWQAMARLRADTTLAAARGELQAIARAVRAEHGGGPRRNGDQRVQSQSRLSQAGVQDAIGASSAPAAVAVASLLDSATREVRPALLALLAAGGLLMLIACANVASLLVARGVARRREMAVRQMLGASRARVVCQLVVENVPLTILSAAAGLALAKWSFAGLLAMVPFGIPRRGQITLDTSTLSAGLVVSVAAGVCFALVPALHLPRRQLSSPLQAASRTVSGRDGGLRHALVAAQFALALAVLTCAGLLTKSFVRMVQVDAGFDHARTLVAETALPDATYASDAQVSAFWRRAIERLSTTAGVAAVGVAKSAPFEGAYPNGTIEFLDEPMTANAATRRGYASASAWSGVATAGFFEALDIPLLQGRLFDHGDVPEAPHVAVINRLAAERFWPGQNPIGRRVRWIDEGSANPDPPLAIVGVVGDVRHASLTVEPVPEIYAHVFQRPARVRDADVVIRATETSTPAALTSAVRAQFAALDRELPLRAHTLESSYRQSFAQPRFQMLLIGFFAVCALLLSAAGLYASMAYAVSRRTREIGIRLALGGAPATVRRQVLGAALRIAAIGSIAGALLGAIGGHLIANQLYGVSARDASVFGAAGCILAVTALFAAYLPARRASRTNPVEALRAE